MRAPQDPEKVKGFVRVSVLVCDAKLLFAQSLSSVLRSRYDLTVAEINPADTFGTMEAAEALQPGVVIAGYWLPRGDPPVTVQAILERSPKSKVILLSSFFQPGHIETALRFGASAFLPRTVSIAEVAEAVRRADAGEFPVFADRLNRLVRRLEDRRADSEQDLRKVMTLTPREQTVLQFLGTGLGVQAIADKMYLSRKTLNNHIYRILSKLGVDSREEAVWVARTSGWMATPPSTQSPELNPGA